MEVELNTGYIPPVGIKPTTARRESPLKTEGAMSFEETQSLEQTLRDLPLVRPEKTVQASALAADPSYPSDEVLNRLANHLAKYLN